MISKPPIKHHRLFPNDIIKFECAKVSWIDKYITKLIIITFTHIKTKEK